MNPGALRGQSLRYAIVGVYNVAFTLAVFWVLDTVWGSAIGVQAVYWSSAALGVVNGFVCQRLIVWKSSARWHAQFVKFILLNVAVSITNSLLLFFTVTLWGLPAFPCQVVITGALVLGSFFVNRQWVFRQRPRTTPEEGS